MHVLKCMLMGLRTAAISMRVRRFGHESLRWLQNCFVTDETLLQFKHLTHMETVATYKLNNITLVVCTVPTVVKVLCMYTIA